MDNRLKPLKPAEMLDYTIKTGILKSEFSILKMLLLGFLAGAFIAFAAEGSNMAAFNLLNDASTYGLGKVLAGAVFGTGLMLVILCGGDLFTGNTLMLTAVFEKKIRISKVLVNWIIVYIGNLSGGIFIAYLMYSSGLFHCGGDMLGAVTVKIAAYKTSFSFTEAFILGVMCNWLVCLAVFLSGGADTMAGKIMSIFFPIWLFATSGFEHSIANMYYIPAGIFAKENISFASLSNVAPEVLANLNWTGFFLDNLLPVTLGNAVGGGIFVGLAYWIIYKKLH